MPNPLDLPEDPTPSRTPDPTFENEEHTQKPPLSIENNPSTSSTIEIEEAKGEETKSLDLGEGLVIKLDKLGPMIVNTDGVSLISLYQGLYITKDCKEREGITDNLRLYHVYRIGKNYILLNKNGQ